MKILQYYNSTLLQRKITEDLINLNSPKNVDEEDCSEEIMNFEKCFKSDGENLTRLKLNRVDTLVHTEIYLIT